MLSIIVIVTLALSFALPFMAVNAALTTPTVTSGDVQPGDEIWVNGSAGDVTSGATVKFYWDIATGSSAWLLNTTTGLADGSYTVQVTVPETPTGSHYVWVEDTATSTTIISPSIPVIPLLEVSPAAGLPDDSVTLTGSGFSAESGFNVSFFNSTDVYSLVVDNDEETDEYGSFSISVDVPTPLDYGDFWFNVTDDTTDNETVAFKVGASIVLDIDEGPEGSVVQVTGRGFTDDVQINETNVEWDDTSSMQIDGDDMTVDDNGEFVADLIIPTWGTGEYEINITDGIVWANTSFTIDGVAALVVTPTYGSPGATITVNGYNFTQVAGLEVTLDLNGTALGTVDTNAAGEFTTTFTVPAVAFEQYIVNATMPLMLTNATDGFKVGIIAVIISPTSGPSGTEVTLTGTGFAEGTYNATLGNETVVELGTVSSAETLATTFFVPVMDAGTYTLMVVDSADNELSTTYTVTGTTSLTATPSEAAIGYNVSLYGEYFAEQNETDLTWYVYNSTWELDITGMVNYTDLATAIEVSENGNFTGLWTVPATLLLGNTYTVNATDDEELWANTTITIVEEEVEIGPTSSVYSLGDTITFRIRATFIKDDAYLEITDPNEELYFMSVFDTAEDEWTAVDPWWVVQIRNQVDEASGYPYIIPTDAATGTWVWSLYESDDELIENGTIEVIPTTAALVDARLTTVEESIDELALDLAEDIGDLQTELAGDIDALSTEIGNVATDVDGLKDEIVGDLADDIAAATAAGNAASDAVEDLEDSLSDLEDSMGDIADASNSALDAAQAAADAAADAATAAEGAGDAAKGLTSLVYGAIGASLIAALAAIVSLMQISKKIAG